MTTIVVTGFIMIYKSKMFKVLKEALWQFFFSFASRLLLKYVSTLSLYVLVNVPLLG